MARKKRDRLNFAAEELALALLFDATGGTVGKQRIPKDGVVREVKVSFQDRRALLDSIVKLIEKRHKMNPEEEEVDGIEAYKDMLNGTSGESGDRGVEPEAAVGTSDSDAGETNDDLI